jgi:hypothetical protein
MGTTPQPLPGMVSEANNLRRTTQAQMDRPGIPGTASTIAWLGYEPPPAPKFDNLGSDLGPILNDDRAQAGATNLSNYLQTVHANRPGAEVSVLGHSYGSLTSSLALHHVHDQGIHAVDNAVFYGSPGLELWNGDHLGLAPGHAYVMQAPDDVVTGVIAPTAPLHGWGLNPYEGILPELSSQAGISPDGVLRDGVGGHADYPRAGGDGALRCRGTTWPPWSPGSPGINSSWRRRRPHPREEADEVPGRHRSASCRTVCGDAERMQFHPTGAGERRVHQHLTRAT